VKNRRLGWADHVARMKGTRKAQRRIMVQKPLEGPRRIPLKWMFWR
jgi:hypothetical protein